MRFEALEHGPEQPKIREPEMLSEPQSTLVSDVLLFGARHGSTQIAKWAIKCASSNAHINKALRAAVDSGHLAVVQLLYPRTTEVSMSSIDDALLESAALLGHLEVFKWIHDNLRNSDRRCFLLFALRCAASSGHLEIVKWIHSKDPGAWTHVALEQAALHSQQHVMDWIYDKRLLVSASFAMRSVAWKGDWQTLAWLHEKYPEDRAIPTR